VVRDANRGAAGDATLLPDALPRRSVADAAPQEGGVMDLIQLVVILIVVGVLLGLANKSGPAYIDATILKIINVVVVVAVVLWLLMLFGVLPLGHHIRVGP
jgi:hypothetical protein